MGDAGDLAARRTKAAGQLRIQVPWCRQLGSHLYGHLLEQAALDCEAGGATWTVLEGHEDMPLTDVLALRMLGAVHRLVLRGEAPALARHYASAGGTYRPEVDPWPDLRDALVAHAPRIREWLLHNLQTNETGRAACLLGGFATLAAETGLPLRLFEVGASAGLNLRFDRFRYESAGFSWGDPASPLVLRDIFEGPPPAIAPQLEVVLRRGCDAAPLDPTREEDRLTLRAFLWPDQVERRARLDAALDIAARVPARVEKADACEWVAAQLAPERGAATVVYHTVVMGYLAPEARLRFAELVRAAGERASTAAPLAWLYLEPHLAEGGGMEARIGLTLWPGGETRILAKASPHGVPVRWIGN